MRGSTKRFAKSYAFDGRNFTSRRADNYEAFSNFCRLILERKIFYAPGTKKNQKETLRLRLAPSLREGGRSARDSAQDDKKDSRSCPAKHAR